jgi:hypothetical protein
VEGEGDGEEDGGGYSGADGMGDLDGSELPVDGDVRQIVCADVETGFPLSVVAEYFVSAAAAAAGAGAGAEEEHDVLSAVGGAGNEEGAGEGGAWVAAASYRVEGLRVVHGEGPDSELDAALSVDAPWGSSWGAGGGRNDASLAAALRNCNLGPSGAPSVYALHTFLRL